MKKCVGTDHGLWASWPLWLMSPHHAGAEQTATDVMRMDDIVVTATKTEKKITDAPGSITVIDQADLQKKDIQTVDDALKSIPGVFVKRTKGLMDSTTSVRLRGFNNDQYTLVLLDRPTLERCLHRRHRVGIGSREQYSAHRGDPRGGLGALWGQRHGRGDQYYHPDAPGA